MKCILFFLFLSNLGLSQKDNPFKAIDKHAQKAPEAIANTTKSLTEYLIQPANSELEKVRSLYTWLTHHIQYDKQAYNNGNKRINQNNADILRRKRAVCFGYSKLFQEMCTHAGLNSEVISGYSKGTLTAKPSLEKPDHAWNAVQINGEWNVLDATWGSSILNKTNDFIQITKEGYFLTSPEYFILNHLPADPMWQLLDCPIPAPLFLSSIDSILQYVNESSPCFNYQDSIVQFRNLPPDEKRLKNALNTHYYHPTESNKKELGHVYIDKAGLLSEKTDALQQAEKFDDLVFLQAKIISLCRKANAKTALYNWQKELFINTLINQAVAQSRLLDSMTKRADILNTYDQILSHLAESQLLIKGLPASTFKDYAQQSTNNFLEITRQNLAIYKAKN